MPYLCRYSLSIHLKKEHFGSFPLSSTIMDSNMAFEMANISIAQNELPQIWPANHIQSQSYLLVSLMSLSFWQYAVTLTIAILVYDQGKESFQYCKNLLMPSSDVYQTKRLYSWTSTQGPAHGPIYTSPAPEV